MNCRKKERTIVKRNKKEGINTEIGPTCLYKFDPWFHFNVIVVGQIRYVVFGQRRCNATGTDAAVCRLFTRAGKVLQVMCLHYKLQVELIGSQFDLYFKVISTKNKTHNFTNAQAKQSFKCPN